MRGCHATEFIKRRHQEVSNELDDAYETITVRLEAKNALMLKALSQAYQFPVSTSFTDIVTKHLIDVLMALNDDDYDKVTAPFKTQLSSGDDDTVVGVLRKQGVLPPPNLLAPLGIPTIDDQDGSPSNTGDHRG